jgi:NAD(P)-dependent dehydrogenase (short-subunit alcohol dehydrogenase family)
MRKTSTRTWTAVGALAGGALAATWANRAVIRHRRRLDLRAKSVLITGGSRGLGILLARRFLDSGANVTICARTTADLSRAQAELRARAPGRVMSVVHDVTTGSADADRLVERVVEAFGSIEILVNNAAVMTVGPMETMTEADYRQAMDKTFWGAFHLVHAALPHMKERGRGGRIVNIASIGGKIAVPHLLPYSASKFALVGFSQGLRAELLKDRIYVTTVCPGLITTGSPTRARFKGQNEKEYAWFAAGDAMPGIAFNPDRLARQVVTAARHGDAELHYPLLTALQVKAHALAPALLSDLFGLANEHLLPRAGGIGAASASGQASDRLEPAFTKSINRAAGEKNNERV